MASDYKVEQVLGTKETWSNDYGTFLPFELVLTGPDAPDAPVQLNRKLVDGQVPDDKVPKVGQSLFLTVTQGTHGWRAKEERREGSFQGSSNGAGRDDATGRSIERQVAAKCAAEMTSASGAKGVELQATFDGMFDTVLAKIQGGKEQERQPSAPDPNEAVPF